MVTEGEADPAAPDSVRLADAAREAGVSVDALKLLIQHQQLDGVVRGRNGSVSMSRDHLPNWHRVIRGLEAIRVAGIDEAERALARVRIEIEAVSNDLAEAREHPLERLGDDLLSLDIRVNNKAPLNAAIARLAMAAWEVGHVDDLLRSARERGL